MISSLPQTNKTDSASGTKLFFDTYGQQPLEFLADDVAAAIGFFESKGFDTDAATSVASILLKQAKLENIPVFQIIDTLKSFEGIEISAVVAEILNNNRPTTSTLGYKFVDVEKQNQIRNIAA